MNRKEKRKYAKTAPDRAKLQGKPFLDPWFEEQTLREEQTRIAYKVESRYRGIHPEYVSFDEVDIHQHFHWENPFQHLWEQNYMEARSTSFTFETHSNWLTELKLSNEPLCLQCKSKDGTCLEYPCDICRLGLMVRYAFNELRNYYRPKDALCAFCAAELKRIKMGDTPCPLDKMEGLLL